LATSIDLFFSPPLVTDIAAALFTREIGLRGPNCPGDLHTSFVAYYPVSTYHSF